MNVPLLTFWLACLLVGAFAAGTVNSHGRMVYVFGALVVAAVWLAVWAWERRRLPPRREISQKGLLGSDERPVYPNGDKP